MDPPTYYAQQSPFTDPGQQAGVLDDLPCDVVGLCRVMQGLVVHYRLGHLFDLEIPEERLPKIDTRYAESMLARIVGLEDRSLMEEHPPEKRLVGCCRDFTVLFVAMARHLGIPRGRESGSQTTSFPTTTWTTRWPKSGTQGSDAGGLWIRR